MMRNAVLIIPAKIERFVSLLLILPRLRMRLGRVTVW